MRPMTLLLIVASSLIAIGALVARDADKRFVVEGFARRTIYHSPQTPGYTCWAGLWTMTDGSLMVTFKQATGPVQGRPRDLELLKKLGMEREPADRDFTGLELANVFLRSSDGGKTWQKVAEEPFPGPIDRPTWGGSYLGLKCNAILRATDGSQLPTVPGLPRRIYFQRSHDFGKTWGDPEIPPEPRRPTDDFLGDAGDCLSRVRRLRDGRLLATGVKRPDRRDRRVGEPVMLLSDDEGRTWQAQTIELAANQKGRGIWDEWDSAELPDGRFLCIFRRNDLAKPGKQARWQGILRRGERAWTFDDYRPAPLEHSGHPELLMTCEGLILHIATTGLHATADAGQTWQKLALAGQKDTYKSGYYPRSLELADGRIVVVSHLGSDNGYGQVDQAIVMDTFRLKRE